MSRAGRISNNDDNDERKLRRLYFVIYDPKLTATPGSLVIILRTKLTSAVQIIVQKGESTNRAYTTRYPLEEVRRNL